jgi:hypothetical protein
MPVVRCAGLVALATALPAAGLSMSGCGAGREIAADATPERRLAAAMLSEDDMPAGYLPAENTPMFQGVRSADPDCRMLLSLADRPSLGATPRADIAFYQVTPGGSVAEHLLGAPPIPAHEFLAGVRKAAAGCDRIMIRTGPYTMRLRRAPLAIGGVGEESYTVRYAGGAGARHRLHLDIVMSRLAGRLLVLTSETLMPAGKARDVAIRIAERAVGKLRGPASIG